MREDGDGALAGKLALPKRAVPIPFAFFTEMTWEIGVAPLSPGSYWQRLPRVTAWNPRQVST